MTWRGSLGAWTRSVSIALGSAVCLAGPAAAQLVRQPLPPSGPKVLVVTFGRNLPSDSDVAVEIGDAFRQRLVDSHGDDFNPIQKRVMCDALDQSGFTCTQELEPAQVGQLANVLNARYIVDGRIFPRGTDSVLVLARMVQAVRTNPMGTAASVVVARAKLSRSVGNQLADRIDDKFQSFEYIQRCRDDRDQKRYDKAIDDAKRALRYDMQSGSALLCMALTMQDQGAAQDTVLKVLEAAHDADSLNTTVARQLAFIYQEKHDTVGLLHMLHHILQVDVNDNDLRKSAARLYVLRGQPDSAVLVLNDALTRNPAQSDLLQVKAIAFGAWQKWDSAAATMSAAAEADSSKVDSTFIDRMLDFSEHAGDTARTIRWLRRGTAKVPTWTANWYRLAALLLVRNDTAGSVEALKQFMKAAPNDGRGHLVYANILEAQGQGDSAVTHARMAGTADSAYRPSAAGVFLRVAVKALQAQPPNFARADTLFGAAQQWATADALPTAAFYRGVAQFQEGFQQLQAAGDAYKRFAAKDQTAREPGCAAVKAATDFFNQAEPNITQNVAVNRDLANQLLNALAQYRTPLTQLGGPRAMKCGS